MASAASTSVVDEDDDGGDEPPPAREVEDEPEAAPEAAPEPEEREAPEAKADDDDDAAAQPDDAPAPAGDPADDDEAPEPAAAPADDDAPNAPAQAEPEADDDAPEAAVAEADDEPDGSDLAALADGDATEEELERAIAGLDADERIGVDGEPIDAAVAAALAEDFDGPLSDAEEESVLAAWDAVDGVELDAEMRGELQDLPPEQFQALAEISPSEIGVGDTITPAFAEQLERQAAAVGGLSAGTLDGLAALFVDALRKKLATVRGKVLERTIADVRAKQEEKIGGLIRILLMLSPLGLLLFGMPLVLRKKYPTQMPTLVRASSIAAVAFTGAMIMFTGLLYVLRTVQGEAAMATNPQIRVVEASFDAVDSNLEEIAAMPGLIEVPLQQLQSGQVDSLEVAILQNVASFKHDVTVFTKVADMFKSVDWLFGWVAIALTMLTIVLFLLTIRPTLTEIVKLPARAAKGEVAPAAVVGMVGRRIGNELLATLGVAGLAIAVALVSGVIEARLVGPAMDVFVMQFLVDIQYVFVETSFSTTYVYVSMGSVVAFLVLNIAVVVMAGGFYIGKSQAILRARFHDKVPLASHRRFWIWGTVGMMWALLLPYAVVRIVMPISQWIVDSGTAGEFAWTRVLIAGPLMLALGFIVLFVAGQGLRGMTFAMKYKLPKASAPAPRPEQHEARAAA